MASVKVNASGYAAIDCSNLKGYKFADTNCRIGPDAFIFGEVEGATLAYDLAVRNGLAHYIFCEFELLLTDEHVKVTFYDDNEGLVDVIYDFNEIPTEWRHQLFNVFPYAVIPVKYRSQYFVSQRRVPFVAPLTIEQLRELPLWEDVKQKQEDLRMAAVDLPPLMWCDEEETVVTDVVEPVVGGVGCTDVVLDYNENYQTYLNISLAYGQVHANIYHRGLFQRDPVVGDEFYAGGCYLQLFRVEHRSTVSTIADSMLKLDESHWDKLRRAVLPCMFVENVVIPKRFVDIHVRSSASVVGPDDTVVSAYYLFSMLRSYYGLLKVLPPTAKIVWDNGFFAEADRTAPEPTMVFRFKENKFGLGQLPVTFEVVAALDRVTVALQTLANSNGNRVILDHVQTVTGFLTFLRRYMETRDATYNPLNNIHGLERGFIAMLNAGANHIAFRDHVATSLRDNREVLRLTQ